MKYKDVQFMTASEKEKVVKKFESFIRSGFKQTLFSKALYQHLHLNCGFIAHYDIHGFYTTYFNGDTEDLKRFFSHFENGGYYDTEDYTDVNGAMADVYKKYQRQIFQDAKSKDDDRFELIKELVKRGETDMEIRAKLISAVL